MVYPEKREIPYQDPLPIFANFAKEEGVVFLDSAQLRENCGRYSFIAIDPFLSLASKNSHIELNGQVVLGDPFQILEREFLKYPLVSEPNLPPFQGGAAGFFSYDLYQHLENIDSKQIDDIEFPDLMMGFYDLVIAFDHHAKRAWIFSSGYPELEASARLERAKARINWLQEKINHSSPLSHFSKITLPPDKITTNFSAEEYHAAVRQVIEAILAGDIFEANISQRFKAFLPDGLSAFDLYRRLRLINPAPFASYMQFKNMVIASASPERFLKLLDNQVEARPIKGTRPRGKTSVEDAQLADELRQSAKDQAENVMIVDLLRNDLSRVCDDHSVQVTQLCGLESYPAVHHLVSVIIGRLKTSLNAIDLLRATFPGGSITGAPKVQAMKVIAEIEPTRRGPYCGCIGYIGFNGTMDTSITIRTLAIKNNTLIFQAGGAITADSDPKEEYDEVLAKANALYKALTYDFIN
jgi:para-aminobenzoate synthetase component 1